MEKLNLNQYLFHGIEPWDSALAPGKSISSVEILKKILSTGYIASRRLLKEILLEEEYKALEAGRMNWNQDAYVSITPTIRPEIEGIHSVLKDYPDEPEDWHGFAYNFYVKEFPAIVLDSILLKDLKVNHDKGFRFIGEIQIEDKILSDYFVGITLTKVPNFDLLFKYLSFLIPSNDSMTKVGYQTWYEKARKDLFQLTEEEFVQKYYKSVIQFEETLKVADSNLKLYDADTGFHIPSSEERMKEVEKFKKMIR